MNGRAQFGLILSAAAIAASGCSGPTGNEKVSPNALTAAPVAPQMSNLSTQYEIPSQIADQIKQMLPGRELNVGPGWCQNRTNAVVFYDESPTPADPPQADRRRLAGWAEDNSVFAKLANGSGPLPDKSIVRTILHELVHLCVLRSKGEVPFEYNGQAIQVQINGNRFHLPTAVEGISDVIAFEEFVSTAAHLLYEIRVYGASVTEESLAMEERVDVDGNLIPNRGESASTYGRGIVALYRLLQSHGYQFADINSFMNILVSSALPPEDDVKSGKKHDGLLGFLARLDEQRTPGVTNEIIGLLVRSQVEINADRENSPFDR